MVTFVNWHWHLLSLLVTVCNVGHDSLVLCPLLNIFTFVLPLYIYCFHFTLYYYLSSLLFPSFLFIPPHISSLIFSISLYTSSNIAHLFCSLSLSLIVAILLIQISGSILVNLLSTSFSLQLLVFSHLSMWIQPSYLLHIGHIPCSVFPLTCKSQPSIFSTTFVARLVICHCTNFTCLVAWWVISNNHH
jgi:hypothetical protein